MEVIDVSGLESTVPVEYCQTQVRRIWTSGHACGGVSVSYNRLESGGGFETHRHDDQDHLYYVLAGEMRVSDGTLEQAVGRGSALLVRAGETHRVTGNGKTPCQYLLVTVFAKRSEAW